MPVNEEIVKRALDALRALSEPGRKERRESEPMTPKVTPAPGPTPATTQDQRGAGGEAPRPNVERELVQRFDSVVEHLASLPLADDSQACIELPTRRCRACCGWLYWVSVHGAVICAGCHPPASPALVKTWYWLPEGEGKIVQ